MEIEQFRSYSGTIRLRRGPGYRVRPEMGKHDGEQVAVYAAWIVEDGLYKDEWAMCPIQRGEDCAWSGLASGDIHDLCDAEDTKMANDVFLVSRKYKRAVMIGANGGQRVWLDTPDVRLFFAWAMAIKADDLVVLSESDIDLLPDHDPLSIEFLDWADRPYEPTGDAWVDEVVRDRISLEWPKHR